MIIDCISDTHNQHQLLDLPGGDILIHSGDATSRGNDSEIRNFIKWFGDQDYSHRIFVPGNHDFGFETGASMYKKLADEHGVNVLIDEGLTVDGLKIWGSPVTPRFYDWAFNRDRGPDIQRHWDAIPDDTQILITHGPAMGVRDTLLNGSNVGCYHLWERIGNLPNLGLHVYGHIHCSVGAEYTRHYTSINASVLNDNYKLTSNKHYIRVRYQNGAFSISS